jgi:hypothetical protein
MGVDVAGTTRSAAAIGGPLSAGETRRISLAASVPASARAAVVNVTAVDATRSTFLTVFAGGSGRPEASTLNPSPGRVAHNVTFVALGADRSINIYNQAGSVEVIVDVLAWSADPLALGEPVAVTPDRVIDTRATKSPLRDVRTVPIAGRAGVPTRPIGAVIMNVTAVNATSSSYITVYPTGVARPAHSNLNPEPGEVRHNLVVSPLGADGSISVFNQSGSVDVAIDVVGWIPASAVVAASPRRLLDTRSAGRVPIGPAQTRSIAVGAAADQLAIVNITSTSSTSSSFVTVWPTGVARPNASNVNPRRGATTHNLAMVRVGSDETISAYHDAGSSHLVIDLLAVVSSGLRAITPTRALDTRAGDPVPPPPPSASNVFTYSVRTAGTVRSDLGIFRQKAAETLTSASGWSRAAMTFQEVPTGGDFTLWLAEPASVVAFGPPCSLFWSCRVGRNVVINDDRWRLSSPTWISAGLALRDYQHMVVNHEVGHWLGYGHHPCGGAGRLAPVMQQQSKDLAGCRFNPWPLNWEIEGVPRGSALVASDVHADDFGVDELEEV